MGADAHGDKSLVGVCELNRNVLRADLKESTVRILHRESGARQFIPGLRSSDEERMLSEVGDGRVDDEVASSCRTQP